MVPAYVPNPIAAVSGGGPPIDGGRTLRDGYRIFGSGKTWRGFITGVVVGILSGLVLIWARTAFSLDMLPAHTLTTVTLLAFGALLGDLVKSFVKRRLGKASGSRWPVADQYDLVAGSLILLAVFDWTWVTTYLTPVVLVFILIVTPILHVSINIIGYVTGVKDVPW